MHKRSQIDGASENPARLRDGLVLKEKSVSEMKSAGADS